MSTTITVDDNIALDSENLITYDSLQANVSRLDVTNRYKELMKASLGEDSVYLRAKETIKDLVTSSNISEKDKASIISTTISNIATNITNTAMQSAIQIAIEDRDGPFKLTKLKEDTLATRYSTLGIIADTGIKEAQIANIGADTTLKTTQDDKLKEDIKTTTINAIGKAIEISDNSGYAVANLDNSSDLIISKNIALKAKFGVNKDDAYDYDTLVELSVDKLRTEKYISLASSYRNNGDVRYLTYTGDDKYTGYLFNETQYNDDPFTVLRGKVFHDTRVSDRNVKAFDDNMEQHAANASASFLAMALGSNALGTDEDGNPTDVLQQYLDEWNKSLTYLNLPSN